MVSRRLCKAKCDMTTSNERFGGRPVRKRGQTWALRLLHFESEVVQRCFILKTVSKQRTNYRSAFEDRPGGK